MRRLLLLLPLLAGCPIGDDLLPKPEDLPPEWRLDKLRILGMSADPPEIQPGTTSRFDALVTGPDGERVTLGADYLTFWLTCLAGEAEDTSFGCLGTPDAQGSLFSPTYQAPTDPFPPDATELQRRDGVYAVGQLFVLPADQAQELFGDGFDGGFEGASFDDLDPAAFSEVESGYKRLVVSEEAQPNRNPTIARFTFDGVPVPEGAVLEVDQDQLYEIGLELTDDAVEPYVYQPDDGEPESRFEEPYVKWYTTGGTMRETITLFGYFQADWESPSAEDEDPPGEGVWWAVVRDRRGGMSWARQAWRVR